VSRASAIPTVCRFRTPWVRRQRVVLRLGVSSRHGLHVYTKHVWGSVALMIP
jgi:hypothetical protein